MIKRPRLLAAAGAALGGLTLGGYVGARQISGAQRPALDYAFTPYEVGITTAEDVTFTTQDGVQLAGWWLDLPDSGDVVVISHGHRGSKADMLGIGPGLWRAGHTALLYDFRGNGDSEDGPQSLAHYEQRDLEAAIALARSRRPEARIHLVGFSMGAATSILVAARDPGIVSVVADSPFADMRGVIETAVRGMRLPRVPILHLVDRATKVFYGYRFADVQPIDVVAQIAPRPLLLIHGTHDSVIPVEHARRLAAAAGRGAQLQLVDGMDHCGAYFLDRPGYIASVDAFLTGAQRAGEVAGG